MKKTTFIIVASVLLVGCIRTGGGLSMEAARHIAEENINEQSERRMVITDTRQDADGWIFSYDSEQAVQTGDPQYSVPGNVPIRVHNDGSVTWLTFDGEKPAASSSAATESSSPSSEGELSWDETSISLGGNTVLTIDDFPDEIQVAPDPDSLFGSSDRIKGAALSPDGTTIAVAIGGAAHDFGWLYDVASKKLSLVAFQYGGGVEVKEWSADSRYVTLAVTSPKPETKDVVIDTQNIPAYPGF